MRDISQETLDGPLGYLVMRSGSKHAIQRETLRTYRIRQEATADPSNADLQLAYLKGVVPTASEEELLDLSGPVVDAVVLRARTGIEDVEAVLGESLGARTENATNDSPPGTGTPTSSTASLQPTA